MRFRFVETILGSLNLQNPVLEALIVDTNLYQAIFYQHLGSLVATNDSFRNLDRTAAGNKIRVAMQLASNSNAALFVTPEYSTPWDVIRDVLSNTTVAPAVGKLWMFGCESIAPAEISNIVEEFSENQDVVIYFDQNILTKAGNFLDPLVYIFRTKDTEENWKTICLVQFKTQHMGVWTTPIERNNLIEGEELYIFRNEPESIYFFGIICSDALTFQINAQFSIDTGHRWEHTPYIIVNIQLNPDPNHQDFRDFRKRVLSYEKKDIATLNWANGSNLTVGAHTTPLNQYSRSAFYTDSNEIDFSSDTDFIQNHTRGLYYTYLKPKWHVFHLNAKNEIYKIHFSKPAQGNAPNPLRRRSAPMVLNSYEILANGTAQDRVALDDELISFLDLRGNTNGELRNGVLNSIDKERLMCLSSGDIDQKEDGIVWHRIDKIELCQIKENGVICRLTFTQDSEGHSTRTKYLDNLTKLNNIIHDPTLIPQNIHFLVGNCQSVMFYHDGTRFMYNFNLVTTDRMNKATGAFCGRLDHGEAKRVFNRLLGLFSPDDNSRKRVVVWHEPTLNTFNFITDPKLPTIADDYSENPSSIKA